jgi:hypothetical protein
MLDEAGPAGTKSRPRLAAALLAFSVVGACTYAPPVPNVRVTHHVRREGSDSIALAVYAAFLRVPTGIAAFPDGGSPLLEHQHAVFYLCVAPHDAGDPPQLRRIATLTPGAEMRHGFEPWVSLWDGPDSFVASLLGYDRATSDTAARHIRWLRVSLGGAVEPLASGRPARLPAATSLPPACEAASVADATRLLADTSSGR